MLDNKFLEFFNECGEVQRVLFIILLINDDKIRNMNVIIITHSQQEMRIWLSFHMLIYVQQSPTPKTECI